MRTLSTGDCWAEIGAIAGRGQSNAAAARAAMMSLRIKELTLRSYRF